MRPRFDSWVGKIPWRRERLPTPLFLGFPGGSDGKEAACNVGDLSSIPGLGRSPLEEGMATRSSNLAWRIPRTEEPHGLQSMWSQRVRHNWVTKHSKAQPRDNSGSCSMQSLSLPGFFIRTMEHKIMTVWLFFHFFLESNRASTMLDAQERV